MIVQKVQHSSCCPLIRTTLIKCPPSCPIIIRVFVMNVQPYYEHCALRWWRMGYFAQAKHKTTTTLRLGMLRHLKFCIVCQVWKTLHTFQQVPKIFGTCCFLVIYGIFHMVIYFYFELLIIWAYSPFLLFILKMKMSLEGQGQFKIWPRSRNPVIFSLLEVP